MRIETRKNKKSTTYRVVIDYYDEQERKKRYTKGGFKTKKEARKHGIEMESKLQTGILPDNRNITISRVFDEWFEVEGKNYSNNTRQNIISIYNNHIKPKFKNRKISEIGYVEFQRFFNSLEHQSHSHNSRIKSILNHLYTFARKAGYINYNPVREVTVTGLSKKERDEYIPYEEFEDMIEAIGASKHLSDFQKSSRMAYMYLGYYLGLRAGEILGLKFSDIDWEKRQVVIQRQYTRLMEMTDKLKTPSSRSTLPVCDILYEKLKEWKTQNPNDLIVCHPDGSPMSQQNMFSYMKRLTRSIGIGPYHPHSLRHTFATNLYKAGIDQRTAARLTRHASLEVLNSVYTHVQMDDIEEAIRKAYPAPILN